MTESPTPASPAFAESAAQNLVYWREAAFLAVAILAFFCLADIQGVLLHRGEYQTARQWLGPGLAYAFGAGLAYWKWDWLERVFLSVRFLIAAAATVALVWWASSNHEAQRPAGVPLLRAGELDRLPLLPQPLQDAVAVSWVTPDPERFRGTDGEGQDGGGSFEYDLPAGWSEQQSTSMRPINLRVAGDSRCECYLSSLPGTAGGLLENLNRWRKQMGADPIDDAALAKLPRAKLLGREAVVMEVDGTFTGMGGGELANARMVGAIASLPAVTLFLKMVGPKEVVAKERAGFDKLLASIRMRAMGKARPREAEPQAAGGDQTPAGSGAEGLRWTAPKGWKAGAERPMRLVTFVPEGTSDLECYVTVLPGSAGGVVDNVNRWRSQFALKALSQTEIEALPTVRVLGQDVPLVELSGTFTGMGTAAKTDFALLGTIVPFATDMLFVKLTGPRAQVTAERDRFLAFVRSLEGR